MDPNTSTPNTQTGNTSGTPTTASPQANEPILVEPKTPLQPTNTPAPSPSKPQASPSLINSRSIRPHKIVSYLFGIVEIVIIVGLLFKLINADMNNSIIGVFVAKSDLLVSPFASLTSPTAVSNYAVDWSYLIALVVYSVMGWIIVKVTRAIFQ